MPQRSPAIKENRIKAVLTLMETAEVAESAGLDKIYSGNLFALQEGVVYQHLRTRSHRGELSPAPEPAPRTALPDTINPAIALADRR